ncbi:hypothetical protein MMC24_001060 [Lignoscripta atroalba]|nr:hypothetical protein [Lignoscripta atroalba]
MARFTDLLPQLRIRNHRYVLVVSSIFPYERHAAIPLNEHGVKYKARNVGGLTAPANLRVEYKVEAERAVGSNELGERV